MYHATRIELKKLPSVANHTVRSAFSRNTNTRDPQLPNMDAVIYNHVPDKANVKAYAAVCGFDSKSEVLPLTYPHVPAFKLHMELMLHRTFPLGIMGMVHVTNKITQHRAIRIGEAIDVRAFFAGAKRTHKGLEVSLRTEIRIGWELVWEGLSTYLALLPSKGIEKVEPEKILPDAIDVADTEIWTLPSNLGLKYGRTAGDPNPIHWGVVAAKAFGFKRHIAHGMWTKARSAAALHKKLDSDAAEIYVEFKQPIYLPAKIGIHSAAKDSDNNLFFEVRDNKGEKVHLKGYIKAI
ncbi:MaoC/PaaZ C-terminal domain-containing protein [Thalassolituus sp.]|jgi:acyl dehydratase|uniref:MaoC family dehydratase n=1 Tax=Thalassolituus sp. TaxID=2030822 RepID=UPI00262F581D|nr:MaoC/PaaZ C-terminal domain-containing protein [uncultured Thalassolituus sp.]